MSVIHTRRVVLLALLLILAPSVPSEKVEIQYMLYGAFGAYGNSAVANADAASVQIPLSVKGRVAEEIKAFAWAPGCRFETFVVKVEGLDIQRTYTCEPSSDLVLKGKLEASDLLHQPQPTEIQVMYLADWACDFFELSDCMVPQFPIGTAQLDSTRHFEIKLPDFSADSASIGSRQSRFQLILREIRTQNPVASLDPESKTLSAPGGGLKLLSLYPNPTLFSASKWR